MPRRRKSNGGSLDSLLDTMTNVVGILVILLTVTQLGVRDAVNRITSDRTVDPEEYAELQAKLAEVFRTHEELRRRRDALRVDEEDDEDTELELRKVKKNLEDAKHNVNVLQETEDEKRRRREEELRALVEEANRLMEEQKKKEKELVAKVNAVENELARLMALLTDTPVQGPLPAKVVNLPNPRPAPEGKQRIQFLCREGRVMYIDIEGLQEKCQKRAEYLVRRKALNRDPTAGIDGKQLVDAFNRDSTVRDRDFDIEMQVQGRLPRLLLKRKENAGETAEQVKRSGSQFRRQIARTDPNKFYVQFLVWPDSFEAYLEARKLASQRGLDAGWRMTSMQGEYPISLGGDLRVGPPPKPQPAPPPEPGPKPPPRPKPPMDVID
jgi:hypothetical protein